MENGDRLISQRSSATAESAVGPEDEGDQHRRTGKDGVETTKVRHNTRLQGPKLEDRRKQARDRINSAGWTSSVGEMAIDFAEARAWDDRPGSVQSVKNFVREIEALGDNCTDVSAIRDFLDRNIHKFIAMNAMEKDFNIPKSLILKASERRTDRSLKYPWFRSFLDEYLGQTNPADSMIDIYRSQSGGIFDTDLPNQAYHVKEEYDGSLQVALPRNSATALASSSYSDERFKGAQTSNTYSNKRQKTGNQTGDLDAFVKQEPTGDDFTEATGEGKKDVPHMTGTGQINDARPKGDIRNRTLTVLFHGMRDADIEESEHVQVYVPRNSKGVTINFL
ncbi:hypothetical protein diail_3409 [Diaporthe ilicicola]|nr:hypothetical protein diail_3409 [Diaporthe ilicicola]